MQSRTRTLSFLFFSLLMLFAVLYILLVSVPPSRGYESSIYDMYPAYLWLMILALLFGGQLLLITGLASNGANKWGRRCAVFVMGSTDLILLSIPFIRGYQIYGREDVLSNIGWTNEILRNGSIGNTDLYPMDHLLAASIQDATSIGVEHVAGVVPIVTTALFSLSFYVMMTKALRSDRYRSIALTLVMIPLFGNLNLSFAPHSQSLLLLPICIYLVNRTRTINRPTPFSLVLIVFTILVVLFHPLTGMTLLVIFAVLGRREEQEENKMKSRLSGKSFGYVLIMGLVVFLGWQAYQVLLAYDLRIVYTGLFLEGPQSELQSYSTLIAYAGVEIPNLLRLVLLTYGQAIALVVAAFWAALHLLRRKEAGIVPRHESLSITISFAFFLLASVVALLLPYLFGFSRNLWVAMIFGLMLVFTYVGSLVSSWRTKPRINRVRMQTVFSIVAFLIVGFSLFNLYPSPTIKEQNQQVSLSETTGMESFFTSRDQSLRIMEMGESQLRYYDLFFGRDAPAENIAYGNSTRIVDHFGYDEQLRLGDSYSDQTYFILSSRGRDFYPSIYPEFRDQWRFTPEDFQMLGSDSTVQLIMTNGDIELFIVTPSEVQV